MTESEKKQNYTEAPEEDWVYLPRTWEVTHLAQCGGPVYCQLPERAGGLEASKHDIVLTPDSSKHLFFSGSSSRESISLRLHHSFKNESFEMALLPSVNTTF